MMKVLATKSCGDQLKRDKMTACGHNSQVQMQRARQSLSHDCKGMQVYKSQEESTQVTK